jgi:hypothetical protein
VNSVEQAIRAALAKGNQAEETFRRRIYASALAALERSFTARPYTDVEIDARRQSLAATIKHIESEYLTAVENDTAASTQTVEDNVIVPITQNEPADKPFEPPVAASANTNVDAPDRSERPSRKPTKNLTRIASPRKSRPWMKYALNGGFLLALCVGGVWAYSEGRRIYIQATTANASNERPVLAEANAAGGGAAIKWIQIFSANDTDLVTAPQGAKAEIISRDGLNVVSMTGDSTHEVSVKIGSGLMQTFAGKRVLFNFKAHSANGTTLETGAHCNFGSDTKCERKRFKIGAEAAEYMFAVSVAANAKDDGALLIAPDLTGGGGAVEIESIRATIVEPDAG